MEQQNEQRMTSNNRVSLLYRYFVLAILKVVQVYFYLFQVNFGHIYNHYIIIFFNVQLRMKNDMKFKVLEIYSSTKQRFQRKVQRKQM